MTYGAVFVMKKRASLTKFLKFLDSAPIGHQEKFIARGYNGYVINKINFAWGHDMDKSFNDQELSDIMKEIEALEDEFKGDEVLTASPVLAELASLSEEQAIPQPTARILSFESKPTPVKAATTSGTAMTFKVQGDLNMDLQFDIGGKVVSLNVSEKGLTIQMDGGMTMNVPLTDIAAQKKSA